MTLDPTATAWKEFRHRLEAVERRGTVTTVSINASDLLAIQNRLAALEAKDAAQDTAETGLAARVAALEGANPPPPVTPLPVAAFTLSASSGQAPLSITLTQTCKNADWYQIDWGAGEVLGTVHDLTIPQIVHEYTRAGTYTISLTAWQEATGQSAGAVRQADISVAAPPAPVSSNIGKLYLGISEPLDRVQGQPQGDYDRHAADMVACGCLWVRGDYPVRQVSPSQGTFTYGSTDPYFTTHIAAGIEAVPLVYMLPQWMNGSSNDKAPPLSNATLATWFRTAAPHLQAIGCHWVEIWNEQNLSGFWPVPNRNVYADLAIRCADAVHETSNLKVCLGGLSTADTQYQAGTHGVSGYTSPEVGACNTLDCYGYLGVFPHVDAISIHSYSDDYDPGVDAMPWPRWAPASLQRQIDILGRWNGSHCQVWNTETGCPRSLTSDATQATRAGLTGHAYNGWAYDIRDRLGPVFWFTLRDRNTGDGREDTFGLEAYPGWGHHTAWTNYHNESIAAYAP